MDLAALFDEHGGAIAADFQIHYGLDIVELIHEGTYSAARLLDMIARLPLTGELGFDLHGERARWSQDRILLADIANTLHALDFHYSNANYKNVKPLKPSDLWQVPGSTIDEPSEDSLEIERRMLEKWAAEDQEHKT